MDPLDLEFQLGEYVDTDALDALAAQDGTEWVARFPVADYVVTVDSDRSIALTVQGSR